LKGGNTTLQIGQELVARVYNAEATTLTDGTVVYISGSQGNRIAVRRASATAELGSSNTLGVVTEPILSGQEGFVTVVGVVRGLNTIGLTPGAILWLSASAGQYTQTRPEAPYHGVQIGYVERVHASVGAIYVKVDNGYELDELHDVNVAGSSYGDLLVKSGSIWINNKQLTGSYGITGSLNVTNQIIGTLIGTASWASNAVSSSFATTASAATSITFTPATASFATTSSFATTASFAPTILPSGVVSSSAQVIAFLPTGTVSSSGQVSYTGLSNVPSGIVSSSNQFNALTNTSASYATRTPLGTSYDSRSITFVGNSRITEDGTGNIDIIAGSPASYAEIGSFNNENFVYVDNSGAYVQTNYTTNPTRLWTFGMDGTLTAPGLIIGTASWASNVISSSFATTASAATSITFTPPTASFATTASYASNATSASYALSASFAPGGGTTFPFTGNAVITGSLIITGSAGLTVSGSASFANDVIMNGVVRNRLNLSTQTTNYTLALGDEGRLIFMASGGANIVTVPSSSTVNFPIGAQVMLTQSGSGQTRFTSASTGVTLLSANNALKIANRYSAATLIKTDANAWYLFGDITV
jgi:hypothetical protein